MHALGCCLLMCKLLIRGFFTLCLLPLDVQAAHQGLLPFACCLRPDAPNKLRCLCVVWYARLRVCMCVSTRTRACACVHVCVCVSNHAHACVYQSAAARAHPCLGCARAGLGVLAGVDEENIDEFEIDLNDAEPSFLKGAGSKSGIEMSPIKIVKNPDGTMQRAAMTQVRRLRSPRAAGLGSNRAGCVHCGADRVWWGWQSSGAG